MPRIKIKEFYSQNKSFLIIFIVMAAYYLQHLISFRLGMNFEEGRDANAYLLVIQGFLPYRDFAWLYGPFSFFIYPLMIKIFGINLIVLRISYIIFASLVIPLAYFLARRVMPDLWAGIAAFLSVIFFDLPYYTFNHVFAVLGGLASLLMVCRFIETDKKISNLFWAGIFAAITILTKPLLPGICLFAVVSLFLLSFGGTWPWRKRIKDYLIFVGSTVLLPLLYLVYFYSQTKLKDIPVAHSLFAWDSTLFIEQTPRINLNIFSVSLRRFTGIFPIRQIINISSFESLKNVFVVSFDNFVFCLPFIVSILVSLIYICSKFNMVSPEIKEKVYRNKKFLLLFVLFSVFISLESLGITHKYGRAYVIQMPFILCTYLLYLIKTFFPRRPVLTRAFITLFLFYISFLHFFRYPYSMLRKYTEPLELERAKGVLVAPDEKELYESLSSYLALNLGKQDKMAVMRYCPQIAFLTEQKNIFEDEEYIFVKLKTFSSSRVKTEQLCFFEDKIISKMEEEKPKIVLDITDDFLNDFESVTSTISDYMGKRYSLHKVFQAADVFGLGAKAHWVKSYKYKKEER